MAKKTAAQRSAERRHVLYLRFAAIYVANGRNATQAYLATHPGVRATSAATHGGQWVRIGEVEAEIRRITAEAWKREHMTAEEVLARMARVSRQDVRDFYWKPDELDRNGQPTMAGQRKPLSDLTDEQAESVKGFKYSNDGRLVQELHDKTGQWANIAKHLKLMTDRVDLHVTTPLDKMIEDSYGENKEQP